MCKELICYEYVYWIHFSLFSLPGVAMLWGRGKCRVEGFLAFVRIIFAELYRNMSDGSSSQSFRTKLYLRFLFLLRICERSMINDKLLPLADRYIFPFLQQFAKPFWICEVYWSEMPILLKSHVNRRTPCAYIKCRFK